MANSFVHLELTDMPSPAGTYAMFKPDNGPGGGIMSMPGAPTAWLPYLGVDDIHAATDKAASLGAQVIRNSHGWKTTAGCRS
jgi:predicted enzyme related to lactoylglutathione lyase